MQNLLMRMAKSLHIRVRIEMNLKYVRTKRLKISQAELAEKLGMKTNSLARIERGERPLLLKTELAIRYIIQKQKRG
jgi:DNA-binding XRE family transcriptional regulator